MMYTPSTFPVETFGFIVLTSLIPLLSSLLSPFGLGTDSVKQLYKYKKKNALSVRHTGTF